MPITHHEKRREALKQLLSKSDSLTQKMLVIALNEIGYKSTQSSVSRDLKELNAIKSIKGYKLPEGNKTNGNHFTQVKDLLLAMFPAGPNLLVVSTAVGAAQRAACGRKHLTGARVAATVDCHAASHSLNDRLHSSDGYGFWLRSRYRLSLLSDIANQAFYVLRSVAVSQ